MYFFLRFKESFGLERFVKGTIDSWGRVLAVVIWGRARVFVWVLGWRVRFGEVGIGIL